MSSSSNQDLRIVTYEDGKAAAAPKPAQAQLMIPCLCADDVVVEVPFNHLRHSHLFDNLCSNLGIDGEVGERGEGREKGREGRGVHSSTAPS